MISCYEASYDGFWLHRLLEGHGVRNHVIDPASLQVDRRVRRGKTDRTGPRCCHHRPYPPIVARPNFKLGSPAFSTGAETGSARPIKRGLRPKGLHYTTRAWGRIAWPAAVILGGDCGGSSRLSCLTSSFWSGFNSV